MGVHDWNLFYFHLEVGHVPEFLSIVSTHPCKDLCLDYDIKLRAVMPSINRSRQYLNPPTLVMSQLFTHVFFGPIFSGYRSVNQPWKEILYITIQLAHLHTAFV